MELSRRNILIAAAAALAVAAGAFLLLRGDSGEVNEGARAPATSPTETEARTDTGRADKPAKRRKQARERAGGPRGGGPRLTSFRGGGPLIGLADNVASNITDPRFRRSGIRRVRVAVPYDDVALGGARRAYQDGWFKAARQVGVEPLVSFYRSTRGTRILPSEAQFRRHVQAVPRALSLGASLLDLERGQLPRPAHQQGPGAHGGLLPDPARRVLGRALHRGHVRLPARRHGPVGALAGDVQARHRQRPPHLGPGPLRGREPALHQADP